MCATCVAQGVGYVGTALVGLQVMGARAKARRRRPSSDPAEAPTPAADADAPSSTTSPSPQRDPATADR